MFAETNLYRNGPFGGNRVFLDTGNDTETWSRRNRQANANARSNCTGTKNYASQNYHWARKTDGKYPYQWTNTASRLWFPDTTYN